MVCEPRLVQLQVQCEMVKVVSSGGVHSCQGVSAGAWLAAYSSRELDSFRYSRLLNSAIAVIWLDSAIGLAQEDITITLRFCHAFKLILCSLVQQHFADDLKAVVETLAFDHVDAVDDPFQAGSCPFFREYFPLGCSIIARHGKALDCFSSFHRQVRRRLHAGCLADAEVRYERSGVSVALSELGLQRRLEFY